MNKKQFNEKSFTSRESFLMSLVNKLTKEYKSLLEYTRYRKPFKIVEIVNLSAIPGDTIFTIQITNKNSILQISAADIIKANYNLNDFNDFHAEMIRKAAQGKLIEFLKLVENPCKYRISSKKFDAKTQQYIFTIENNHGIFFTHTAEELSKNKKLLSQIDLQDIYDIGFTQGTESILKEKSALMLIKQNKI